MIAYLFVPQRDDDRSLSVVLHKRENKMKPTEIKVPIKKYWLQVFFFPIASILLFGLIIFILFFASPSSEYDELKQSIYGAIVLQPLFAFYSFWLLVGYEKITIDNNKIVFTKSNRIFSKSKNIDLNIIESIEVVRKDYNSDSWYDSRMNKMIESQRAFPFWIKMGQLKVITSNNKKLTFFNGLSYSEAHKMKDMVVREIEKRKHNKI